MIENLNFFFVEVNLMMLSQACRRFLDHCCTALTLSGHTVRAYSGDLRDFLAHAGSRKKLESVGRDDLRNYIRHLRDDRMLKESSIKRKVASLKLLFRWSMQEALLAVNPFDLLNERIRLPRRLPRALSQSQVLQLRREISNTAVAGDFDLLTRGASINLLLETGIRVGELSSITVDDLSLPDQCLKVHGKGNRQRLVYILSPALIGLLGKYVDRRKRKPSGAGKLFVTSSGHELTPERVRASLREMAEAAGICQRVTPHMLRHTCATQWLEAGVDIRYVQKLLGHQSISTTEIYTHVSDYGLRAALERARGGVSR